MPWITQEEDLRKHFSDVGTILNVRIIRDKVTHIGKGFGYIQFANKDEMKKAIADKNKSKFHNRELRVKKAVEPKRLEKKQNRKRDKKLESKEAKKSDKVGFKERVLTP
jgi:nucleolar protein 12